MTFIKVMVRAAGAAAVAAAMLAQPAAAQNIKIGVVTTYSGPLASPGVEMDKGLSLYVDTHKKDLPPGVTVELIKRDDTNNPDVGKRVAQELITRDQVQFLCGAVYSPIAAAIAPLAGEAKVPFVIMNAAGSSITRISPYVVRDSFTLWQVSAPMGQWAAKNGIKEAYTAVSDYAPGIDAEGGFKKGFEDNGGKIVGSVRFPLGNPDFVPFLQRVKDAKPQALFVFVPAGPQSTQMIKAFNDLGLKQAGIKLITTQDLVVDSELPNMGDAPLGVVDSGTYTISADRPANKAFLDAWKKAYGDSPIPDFVAADSWDGMAMIFDAIKKTAGKGTGDQMLSILSNYKTTDSPRGSFSIDPTTRDVVQNIYIARVEKKNGKLANVPFSSVPNVKDIWKELNPPKPQ
jgi:branched-chain amino acid transport system substrate-binding protein